jgi:hypothetical protein
VGVSEEFRQFWNSCELIATIPELNGTELDAIPELDGIDSGGGIDSAMFNIAE